MAKFVEINIAMWYGINMKHDELSKLYTADPASFEITTRKMIDDHINSLPIERQQAIRCFQWKIDQTLSRYKDPIARMNKMVELLWAGVHNFQAVLDNPSAIKKSATIKSFEKR